MSGSHCGEYWILMAGLSEKLERMECEKRFWWGKSYFRPQFSKEINWIIVIFFFLEHSLTHSYMHWLAALWPCGSNCDRDTWSCVLEALTIYSLTFYRSTPTPDGIIIHLLSHSFTNYFYPQTILSVIGICFYIFPSVYFKIRTTFRLSRES